MTVATQEMREFIAEACEQDSRIDPGPWGVSGGIVGEYGGHVGYRNPNAGTSTTRAPLDKLPADSPNLDDSAAADLVYKVQALLHVHTRRLWDAMKSGDPRTDIVAEFCGSFGDDNSPEGLTRVAAWGIEWLGVKIVWDKTHLTHLHIRVWRRYTRDRARLRALLDVLNGVPLSTEEDDMQLTDKVPVPDALLPHFPPQLNIKKGQLYDYLYLAWLPVLYSAQANSTAAANSRALAKVLDVVNRLDALDDVIRAEIQAGLDELQTAQDESLAALEAITAAVSD